MTDLTYRTLVWLTYRLASTFAIGLPLVLMIWASIQREGAIVRLLSIYWKSASLLAISILLLTNQQPIGYITSFIAPLLMVASVWFWVDLNEELVDFPQWRPLPLTFKVWRWALTGFGFFSSAISISSFPCINIQEEAKCLIWLEAPQKLHLISDKLFSFLFGANWSEPLAAFVGYIALIAYIVGLLQWILIKLPKQGRIAGGF